MVLRLLYLKQNTCHIIGVAEGGSLGSEEPPWEAQIARKTQVSACCCIYLANYWNVNAITAHIEHMPTLSC